MARKKVDLSKAKVADGAQRSAKSVYEICGIGTTSYKHASLGEYSKMLNSLNVIELQDHAYQVGVLAGPDRSTLIGRLEDKYILENSKFSPAINQPRDESKGADPKMRAEAEKIISRGK